MQVVVLASGSKGNCTFIELQGVRLLVDAGISTRRIKQELSLIGENIEDLDGIFITHEHSDHIKALPVLTKRYKIPVFSRPATFRAMSCYNDIPTECINAIKDSVRLGRIQVKTFDIPHDAADPVGYAVVGSEKCCVATDIGFFTEDIGNALEGARVLVLEANHDEDMVRNGPYPFYLKQRILGNRGHLSNTAAGWILANMKQPPKYAFLAHLSHQNNTPELAISSVKGILIKQGRINHTELIMTHQSQAVGIEL